MLTDPQYSDTNLASDHSEHDPDLATRGQIRDPKMTKIGQPRVPENDQIWPLFGPLFDTPKSVKAHNPHKSPFKMDTC